MNSRIKELRKQAAREVSNANQWTNDDEWNELFMEKFAELIVQACADAADMAQDARCKYVGDYVAEQMGYGQEKGVTEWRTK